MSWKKNIAVGSATIGITTLTLHMINKLIYSSASGNSNDIYSGSYYKWKFGNIFYTKQGNGNPLLLIHDLSCYSSSAEWNRIIDELSTSHTVYTIDLLGCGHSDKPNITYTCYMYVQLIHDFIKEVIKQNTDIIATGISSAFAIGACQNDSSLINRIILVNPENIEKLSKSPSKISKTWAKVINVPIFGTFLYNVMTKKEQIKEIFLAEYYYNQANVDEFLIDLYYRNAHTSHSDCKYLYASIIGRYITMNLSHCLESITNSIFIISGDGEWENRITADEYKLILPAIEIIGIEKTKHLPQLERHREFIEQIDILLSDPEEVEEFDEENESKI